jgi:hypothetical protein
MYRDADELEASPTWDVAQERELTEAFVFAVDSAFHENGLQYGNADETVGRVLKKLIRSAFAIEAYLDVAEANVIFAAPKMAETVQERIQHHLGLLEKRLAEQRSSAMPKVHFRIIANADFADEILAPVLEQVDAVADTSELFMRAQQLMRLCHSSPRSGLCRWSTDRSDRRRSPRCPLLQGHIQSRASIPEAGRPNGLTAEPANRSKGLWPLLKAAAPHRRS